MVLVNHSFDVILLYELNWAALCREYETFSSVYISKETLPYLQFEFIFHRVFAVTL